MSQQPYNPNGLNETMARVETKLDNALLEIIQHRKQIAILERWRNWTIGAAAAVSALIGEAIQWVSAHWKTGGHP